MKTPTEATERALRDLKRRASEGGALTGGVQPTGAPFPIATGETGYYGTPVLKKPVWTWEVPLYFFVGGAAGAAAIIGAAATWSRRRTLARDARRIAAGGGALSAALLTMDLGRPERFIYMLRVFKPYSAMSVGSWTLTAFSGVSTATALMELVPVHVRRADIVRLADGGLTVLSAILGGAMATYTGVLIGATAVPVWNTNAGLLPAHFAASGVGSAVAVLDLAGHDDRGLNDLGLAAAAVETVVGAALESRAVASERPLKEGASGALVRAGGVLSGPIPLVLRVLGRRRPMWRRAASLAAIAGSILTRFGWIAAGRESTQDASLQLNGAEGARTSND